MLRDITFGQYYESNSLLHKTDPRFKIVILILLIVFIFLAKNAFSLGFAAAAMAAVMLISRVPLRLYLKNMKAILPVLLFTAVINLFYGDGGRVLFSVWKLTVNTEGVYRAVFMAVRIILLILISSALTYTTTPNDLTDAIESLLSPLKYVGLKSAVHTLAMMMTIALRFIPTLIEETDKIMSAQKARGASLDTGGLVKKAKALIPVLIPLFVSAFKRANELALAMECRCYKGGEGRTRMKQLKFGARDIIATVIMAAMITLTVLMNIYVPVPGM